MNKKFLIYFLATTIAAAMVASCNSDDKIESVEYVPSSDVAITSFSLGANTKILSNLDSVFFTIDLKQGLIYNADSLPLGTDVTRMLVNLSSTSASNIEFNIKNGTRLNSDTTFTYNSTDSIDFSGDVRLTVTAEDLVTKMTYKVKLNIHKMKPDSLYWNKLARRDLPSLSGEVTEQRTVKYAGKAYCLMVDKGRYVLASIDNLMDNVWTKTELTMPFNPDVRSLTATDDAVYVLDADNGALYSTTDFTSWQSCGVMWKTISGGYQGNVLGVAEEGGILKYAAYPAIAGFEADAIAEDFPVKNSSDIQVSSSIWHLSPIGIMIGGEDASGRTTGHAWGFDGKRWGRLSTRGIIPHSGMALVPYKTFDVSSGWRVSEFPTLLAFGGRLADGTLDNTVYISRDNGVSWNRGDLLIQLPDYIEKVSNADALVFASTLTDSRSAATDAWTEMPSQKLPVWCTVVSGDIMSRATTEITEWNCPYIYVFGGVNSYGELSNNIWRGVINRLSFKPIY